MPRRVEPKSELAFRAARSRARPYLLADGNGLALRVRPNGAKTWLFRYRRPGTGKETFLSLGPYPEVTLPRRSAATARSLVREGTDPVEHRRAESTARRRVAEGAFHLVAQRCLDFKRKEWADETYRKAEFVVREYLTPALRNKPISTLATPEVKPVLEAIASHAPNLATKARQFPGGIVTYCEVVELISGGRMGSSSTLHLPFRDHVHLYERLPFAKAFACSNGQDGLQLYIRPDAA